VANDSKDLEKGSYFLVIGSLDSKGGEGVRLKKAIRRAHGIGQGDAIYWDVISRDEATLHFFRGKKK
jgi:hypothetical protein